MLRWLLLVVVGARRRIHMIIRHACEGSQTHPCCRFAILPGFRAQSVTAKLMLVKILPQTGLLLLGRYTFDEWRTWRLCHHISLSHHGRHLGRTTTESVTYRCRLQNVRAKRRAGACASSNRWRYLCRRGRWRFHRSTPDGRLFQAGCAGNKPHITVETVADSMIRYPTKTVSRWSLWKGWENTMFRFRADGQSNRTRSCNSHSVWRLHLLAAAATTAVVRPWGVVRAAAGPEESSSSCTSE